MPLKILLTGASGFVGSHILDALRKRGLPTAILLRPTSPKRWVEPHLPDVEVRAGSVTEPASLRPALAGVTHVVHCAGCIKARRVPEFYEVNQLGTRHLVEAVNDAAGAVRRLVHVSSLAAAGPALPESPARETDSPHPVSEYGRSKLAGELEVRDRCRADYVILRPPAVYGPRDGEFLRLFKAVKGHVRPKPPNQPLSLVFVKDLAEAAVRCLEHPAVAGKTYFVAAGEVVTVEQMAREIAGQMNVWTVPCPLPTAIWWPLCLVEEIRTRLTGKAHVLSLQKLAELRAPGWVCDPARLQRDVGFECATTLESGIAETLQWYRANHWLSNPPGAPASVAV